MSSAIVLPDLPHYVQQRVSAIYGAKTAEAFDSAFDAFVSQHATIRVNGAEMSRADYKALLQGQTAADTSEGIAGIVTVNNVVSVPSKSKDLNAIGTGSVGMSFDAEVFGRFFIFAERQSSTVASSLNVVYVLRRVLLPARLAHARAQRDQGRLAPAEPYWRPRRRVRRAQGHCH
ncbi:uncharacterized protein TRAVEDRAFT_127754 [Trametes versicolor FP-101664 SS1]|uniref:uncharacterized protein n=1 Tax=Trametes versicolor (strain FP-101664) TaxID=717944 RepID=UPI000462410E|nr:uncharacterized protein TRAVEDRAFT_127754 [Trametes versicolor FP-101664 SS1]EIW56866.1 hypothetical protein TRAVEDRAFT_127754 [Trametes versicolor FP-101664 SS1]